ncbi:MAG: orotate phosphoribosyltransferase [Acidimicrobiaceae bacterium]|nr:orotate phosphoribosyltransferase [Acidimicrobiaceae bacterium]MYH74075.1 orotate phosphoribosyltransferase [Acidimicrobiales bacterium]MYK70773.1 orotate phosphoribosyltransferase [Acidimicrobiales bacterium]
MSSTRTEELLEILRSQGLTELPEPVQLASGNYSRYFIDGKVALGAGDDLRLAAEAINERVTGAGVTFDAVGGLTLGADALCAAIAVVSGAHWFIVRKEAKGRGTNRLVEGTRIGEGHRVLLIDDVVTTGGSILKAYESVSATGAQVVAAVTLADRGDDARRSFKERGVPYFPMATYQDMGIPAIGTETATTAAD